MNNVFYKLFKIKFSNAYQEKVAKKQLMARKKAIDKVLFSIGCIYLIKSGLLLCIDLFTSQHLATNIFSLSTLPSNVNQFAVHLID